MKHPVKKSRVGRSNNAAFFVKKDSLKGRLPMQFGAMNFPILPVIDELERINAQGFDFIELAMDPPEAHYSHILDIKSDLTAALKRLDMGIVCHLPTFVFTADLTDSIRNASVSEILNAMDTAVAVGAKKAVLHPCMATGMARFVPRIMQQHAWDSLSVILEKANAIGLKICFENMFPRLGSYFDPDAFEGLFERFPSLSMTLDIAHACIQDTSGNKALKFIDRFFDRINHVHVSDNKGKFDDHLAIGKGVIPYNRIIPALVKKGYNGTITFEVFSEDPKDLPDSRQKISFFLPVS